MIILTNCLASTADEGCLKVAGSLIKRIIKRKPDTTVISYDRMPSLKSIHLNLNKLFLNMKLFRIIKAKNEPVVYIPFPAKEWATAIRVFVLSLMCKHKLTVVFTMLCNCNFIGRLLLNLSGATLVTFSENTANIYCGIVGNERVKYLKTGVDLERFSPVSIQRQIELKEKYGFKADRPVILHVGHLKYGRNIAQLMKIHSKYQILLVISTLTKDDQDADLKADLQKCTNIRLIEEYIPNIEEIYQLSDLYFFPVIEKGNCIDVPLSCLEAASCNKPIITTKYGEMATFSGKHGFWFIDNFDEDSLNRMIGCALEEKNIITREHVLPYDWDGTIEYFEV